MPFLSFFLLYLHLSLSLSLLLPAFYIQPIIYYPPPSLFSCFGPFGHVSYKCQIAYTPNLNQSLSLSIKSSDFSTVSERNSFNLSSTNTTEKQQQQVVNQDNIEKIKDFKRQLRSLKCLIQEAELVLGAQPLGFLSDGVLRFGMWPLIQ